MRPVGSTHEIPIDIRLVASTNRDPAEAARTGQLRTDLYYRLQVNVLEIAPLRERSDDIAALAQHFLKLLNERNEGGKLSSASPPKRWRRCRSVPLARQRPRACQHDRIGLYIRYLRHHYAG